jgi:hypothetical protein
VVGLPRVIESWAFVAEVADKGVLSDHPGSSLVVTRVLASDLLPRSPFSIGLVIPHFLVGITA